MLKRIAVGVAIAAGLLAAFVHGLDTLNNRK
jgi:hypothetical protein